MRRPWLLLSLVPLAVLGACDDFLDPELGDDADEVDEQFGDAEFEEYDDLGHLGEPGAYDSPGLDPVETGDPLVPQALQIASVSDPSLAEELDADLASEVRPLGDGLVSFWLVGQEVIGTTWVEGGQVVVYGLTSWDFADDGVDGPVQAELIGVAGPPGE